MIIRAPVRPPERTEESGATPPAPSLLLWPVPELDRLTRQVTGKLVDEERVRGAAPQADRAPRKPYGYD